MGDKVPKGRCMFCNGSYTYRGMAKHLMRCSERLSAIDSSPEGKGRKGTKRYHLMVRGANHKEYWLHLDIAGSANLEDLDTFLRDIWLECCGHLSTFTIGGTKYMGGPGIDDLLNDGLFRNARDMNIQISKVLYKGLKFQYKYDFGTTTELVLEVVDERSGSEPPEKVLLLARNDPPDIRCVVCGKVATKVCTQCAWNSKGWLCEECASRHECGEEMMLPVVNSPRVGFCAYTGGIYD